ncbi:Zn finger [Haloarcula virus HCTV-16]|nr:Zn finger [Haloarcula virus HCTV-16]
MTRRELRLNCTRCGDFTHASIGSTKNVVVCDDCGKRHSQDSLHFIDLDKDYERDESGQLIEDLP